MNIRPSLLLVAFVVLGCSTAPAEPEYESLTGNTDRYTRLADFPRHFSGSFEWDEVGGEQGVEIWFDRVEVADDGTHWVATGRGEYVTRRVTRIKVRARIHPETLKFQMWESDPDTDDFDTDGHHEGRISPTFEFINARWKGNSGEGGDLNLEATEPENDDRHPQ